MKSKKKFIRAKKKKNKYKAKGIKIKSKKKDISINYITNVYKISHINISGSNFLLKNDKKQKRK